MIVKLLGFNAQEFIINERASYQEKLQMFKRQKRMKWLLISAEIVLFLSVICHFLYYISIKNSVMAGLGILLVGISVGILLKNAILDNLYFLEQPKQDYEFEFIQAVLDSKNITSAEIIYNSIFLQYNLKFTYDNNEQKCSGIKINLQEKKDIECKKIETQAVCVKASEEVNVNTNESVMSYSFNTEDEWGYRHKTYYDADIEYKKGNTYDCTLYQFSCIVFSESETSHRSITLDVLVIGNGTTSYKNNSFDFDKTVDECLEEFTEQIIEYKIDSYSTLYKIMVGVSSVVLALEVINLLLSDNKEKINYKELL